MADFSLHKSIQNRATFIVDRHKSALQLELSEDSTGHTLVGEFDLEAAEEIAAAIAHVCRQIRKDRVSA